jgi:choline monooxygenase
MHAVSADFDLVAAPIGAAKGLPSALYTDPDVFEAEKEVLFAEGWACIGFGKDLAGPRTAKPVDFLGQPLLMVRDREGVLRVFQNVCRHRGMVLVDAGTKLGSVIRCPYHSWCYNFDGSLRATPHVGGPGHNVHPAIDRASLGLIEIRSHVFMDMVFVNLSGTAPAFEDHAASLIARWSEFADRPLFHGGDCASFALDVATNWKLAVENYCESYHLPWVHPGLNSYSRLEDHYNIVEAGCFSGQGTTVYDPQLAAVGKPMPNFPGLSERWSKAAEYVALYPNVLLGVHPDHTFAIMLDPQSPDRTIERVEVYYADPEMASDGRAELRERHCVMWREVFEEDIFVVEGMQRGRSALFFDGGRFSPVMDEATHCFHRWVAERFSNG